MIPLKVYMDNSVLHRSSLRRSYMAEKGLCINIQNSFQSAETPETIVFKNKYMLKKDNLSFIPIPKTITLSYCSC